MPRRKRPWRRRPTTRRLTTPLRKRRRTPRRRKRPSKWRKRSLKKRSRSRKRKRRPIPRSRRKRRRYHSDSESDDSLSDSVSPSRSHSTSKRRKRRKRREKKHDRDHDDCEWEERELPPPEVILQQNHEEVGPMPLPEVEIGSYGGQLLKGEGEAMARFVQQNKRIPRRGEVGLSAEQIANFEQMGYVMSGSRNKVMTAVRIRKENQVYSAEEKRAMLLQSVEEKAKRENKIIAEFREMLAEKDLAN
mmetsp:Transcript_20547/g.78761  ORF Transcript_20547/g.78761 Transcript_20547/m.78761 type:complete len:247 (+) Transcript_20547:3436-4176(+)